MSESIAVPATEETKRTSKIVTLSDAAADKLRQIMTDKSGAGIRLGVVGGGCAGFSYEMEPADAPGPEDLIQEEVGLRFFIHPKAALYLTGIHIDYVEALINGGFKFSNPNAKNACGCGTSFGV